MQRAMNKLTYLLLVIICLSACAVDNYDPPSSTFNGQLVYEGQPIQIRQGISVLQLYQPGYENQNPIAVNVKQDGSFSSTLFDGTYKLVRVAGNGPWENNPDSITVDVHGTTTIDVPVVPFFSISDVSFEIKDDVLIAQCKIKKNVESRQLEKVSLFFNKTTLVDHTTLFVTAPTATKNAAQISEGAIIELQQDLTGYSNNPYLFARIGVKAVGHPEYIYSVVWKVR